MFRVVKFLVGTEFMWAALFDNYGVIQIKRNQLKKKLYKTSSSGKLCFAQKCILGEWLYNVTKCIGRV